MSSNDLFHGSLWFAGGYGEENKGNKGGGGDNGFLCMVVGFCLIVLLFTRYDLGKYQVPGTIILIIWVLFSFLVHIFLNWITR